MPIEFYNLECQKEKQHQILKLLWYLVQNNMPAMLVLLDAFYSSLPIQRNNDTAEERSQS